MISNNIKTQFDESAEDFVKELLNHAYVLRNSLPKFLKKNSNIEDETRKKLMSKLLSFKVIITELIRNYLILWGG